MRIGIFFGGKSREREISFAGGRTVYDLLDKSLFTPVPIFVDSLGNFILLDWQYLYKGSIRDFYPPVSFLSEYREKFQVYIESLGVPGGDALDAIIGKVGKKTSAEELKNVIDFAFMALHGPYGEDGSLQGLLEFYDIPYSGSGVLPSAIGINKMVQKHFMKKMNIRIAESLNIRRDDWVDDHEAQKKIFEEAKARFALPVVLKSSSQGSSIGVSILKEWDIKSFCEKIDRSFFIKSISRNDWVPSDSERRHLLVQQLCDIYEGIGIPLSGKISPADIATEKMLFYHPAEVYAFLDKHFSLDNGPVTFYSMQTESAVLVEEFIKGREFSCIVVEGGGGEPIALPPTEIIKTEEIFNYRAKYLPGISRKITPINLPGKQIEEITASCEGLFEALQFDVYARIDGMIQEDGSIYLNDPNTTSGMLPSSFFFHQAAEIGLSPSQFLTYIIHKSLQKRKEGSHSAYKIQKLIDDLEKELNNPEKATTRKWRIGVILGGTSTERHISVESGRNVFEKLSSSGQYDAIPIFLDESDGEMELYILPMNLLLKDNADDIREKVKHFRTAPIITKIIEKANYITRRFASEDYEFHPRKISIDDLHGLVDSVFIALHGRPGEDGTLQKLLEPLHIPYNGSGIQSSEVTINKFVTNELLKQHGLLIPAHYLVQKSAWREDAAKLIEALELKISYPLIAKPADDGCSSAVKKINNREEMREFTEAMFRDTEALSDGMRKKLSLKGNEEFPRKEFFVVEELVAPKGARHFIEITGGMLTTFDKDGEIKFEIFEPSEALASKGILSLEEKFLAGEGQNITPARFSTDAEENKSISAIVRNELERAAKALHIEGYCRIDAFVRIFDAGHVEVIFIEVNSLPGLTPATCIFHQAALNGYKPAQFLDHIIQYGAEKEKRREPRKETETTRV